MKKIKKSIKKIFRKISKSSKRTQKTKNIFKFKSMFYVYVFFLIYTFVFGFANFLIAYVPLDDSEGPIILFSIFSLIWFLAVYAHTFGKDTIIWFFVNSIMSIIQVKIIINLIGNFLVSDWNFYNYPLSVHIIPSIFVILGVFIFRRSLIDLFKAIFKTDNEKYANTAFIITNVIFYFLFAF